MKTYADTRKKDDKGGILLAGIAALGLGYLLTRGNTGAEGGPSGTIAVGLFDEDWNPLGGSLDPDPQYVGHGVASIQLDKSLVMVGDKVHVLVMSQNTSKWGPTGGLVDTGLDMRVAIKSDQPTYFTIDTVTVYTPGSTTTKGAVAETIGVGNALTSPYFTPNPIWHEPLYYGYVDFAITISAPAAANSFKLWCELWDYRANVANAANGYLNKSADMSLQGDVGFVATAVMLNGTLRRLATSTGYMITALAGSPGVASGAIDIATIRGVTGTVCAAQNPIGTIIRLANKSEKMMIVEITSVSGTDVLVKVVRGILGTTPESIGSGLAMFKYVFARPGTPSADWAYTALYEQYVMAIRVSNGFPASDSFRLGWMYSSDGVNYTEFANNDTISIAQGDNVYMISPTYGIPPERANGYIWFGVKVQNKTRAAVPDKFFTLGYYPVYAMAPSGTQ